MSLVEDSINGSLVNKAFTVTYQLVCWWWRWWTTLYEIGLMPCVQYFQLGRVPARSCDEENLLWGASILDLHFYYYTHCCYLS